MNEQATQYIGKYEVLRELSHGGQSWVYLAADPNLRSHRVVLKVFRLANLDDIERCRREADALARLESCPGFVGIKDFFQHGEYWVLALPYLEGRSLADRLRNEGPLPPAEAIRIVLVLLNAIETAHDKGIFHRDIKPSNVMLLRGDDVKLIDFGLAKSITDPDITEAGMLLGSMRFMAPEQFPPIPPGLDYERVDVYQLGATFYHMLTAQHAFDEPTSGDRKLSSAELWMALREAKLGQDPIPPSRRRPGLDPELERIVLKAMARELGDRYASASEMLADLTRFVRGESASAVARAATGTDTAPSGSSAGTGATSTAKRIVVQAPVAAAATGSAPAAEAAAGTPAGKTEEGVRPGPRPPLVTIGLAIVAVATLALILWWANGRHWWPGQHRGETEIVVGKVSSDVKAPAATPPTGNTSPGGEERGRAPAGGASPGVSPGAGGAAGGAADVPAGGGGAAGGASPGGGAPTPVHPQVRPTSPGAAVSPIPGTVTLPGGPPAPQVPAAVPVGTGRVNVVSTPPGAQIFLDGKDMQQHTNYILDDVPAGPHQLSVRMEIEGRTETRERSVQVVAGQLQKVTFSFQTP